MEFKILLMIVAFITGTIFSHLSKGKKPKVRKILEHITVMYLLFKIGFLGGGELVCQQWQTICFQSIVAVVASSLWTLFVLVLLKRWSSFERTTQVSIATHFGSVSVGTFIAAIAFLEAMKIAINPGAVTWLSIMEFPAIIIGMWKLGICPKKLLLIMKEKWTLAILPISLILGLFFGKSLPETINYVLFGPIFIPILLYFLFEMGCKSSDNLSNLKKDILSVVFVGVLVPILGGIFGSAIGYWMGYSTSGMFIMAVLMASASYVLAPLCIYEILKSIYKNNQKIAKQVVSISMALSVGVTLPFNILIGLELYYVIVKAMQTSPVLAFLGIALPVVLTGVNLKYWK